MRCECMGEIVMKALVSPQLNSNGDLKPIEEYLYAFKLSAIKTFEKADTKLCEDE